MACLSYKNRTLTNLQLALFSPYHQPRKECLLGQPVSLDGLPHLGQTTSGRRCSNPHISPYSYNFIVSKPLIPPLQRVPVSFFPLQTPPFPKGERLLLTVHANGHKFQLFMVKFCSLSALCLFPQKSNGIREFSRMQ